jgi:hypothetical protein
VDIRNIRLSFTHCDCIVWFSFDNDLGAAQRVITPTSVDNRCARHAALTEIYTHFNQVRGEAQRLQLLTDQARVQFPAMWDGDGQFLGSWDFDAGHTLHFHTVGLTKPNKSSLQAWADGNFGLGEVVIE